MRVHRGRSAGLPRPDGIPLRDPLARVDIFLSPVRAWRTALLAALACSHSAAAQTAVDKSQYTLFDPTPASALRAFSPDRPTRSNGPYTVDAGWFDYETDLLSFTHLNVGGVDTRTFIALDPTLKVGLTRLVDFEVQFNGYTNTRTSGLGAAPSGDGAGDLVLRSKINLFGDDGGAAAAALIPYIKFPTAAVNLGNNQVEGGVIAPLAVTLPAGFVLTAVAEFDVLKNNNDSGKHANYVGVLDLAYGIDKKWTVFGELYGAVGTDAYSPPATTADVAIAYLLTDQVQLDAGANIGLNRNAPDVQVYAGISQRF